MTDHVVIMGNITYNMLVQISNSFKNIKSLDISGFRHELVITSKITLPSLLSLRVNNTEQLSYFTRLMSLKHIQIACWDKRIDIDEVFDPSKILEVDIGDINCFEVFPITLFTNLRSLKWIIISLEASNL